MTAFYPLASDRVPKVISPFLGRLSDFSKILAFITVLIQPLAVAGPPDSAPAPLENAAVLIPEIRDAAFNADSLVAQPVSGAAWLATARIGIRDDSTDARQLWGAALSTARSTFAYDVSKDMATSAALVKGYADKALRAELSDDDIAYLFAYFRSSEGRQYLEFQREVDGVVDYAGSRALLQMALTKPMGQTTTTVLTRATVDRRREVINLSRSAATARLADQLVPLSDRIMDFGPAPWEAVIALSTEPHGAKFDLLLVQYQSALDRLALSIERVSSVDQLGAFSRMQTATRKATTQWLNSAERLRIIKGISNSMEQHLPCWQALFRDNKEIQCVKFAPH